MDEKISLDKINFAYRRLVDSTKAINSMVDQGETWNEDHWNPLHTMKIPEDKSRELKTSIERFLASRYAKMCSSVDLFGGINYHEWFAVEDFDASAFVRRLDDAVSGKVDEIALKDRRSKAGGVFQWTAWGQRKDSSAQDQAVEEYVVGTTVVGETSVEYHRNEKKRMLSWDGVPIIDSFLWLAAFLDQPQIGAISPSKFKSNVSVYREREVPFNMEFHLGPVTSLSIYANSKVKFRFKKREQAEITVRAIFGEPVTLHYRKTKLDPDAIFRQDEYQPQRVVKICAEGR